MVITRSTVSGNRAGALADATASGFGGGIDIRDGGLTITNSTISGNTIPDGNGQYGGGGIGFTFANVVLVHSTVTRNHANGEGGGGIRSFNDSVITLQNTIVAGNTGAIGPDIRTGGTVNADFSLIGDTTAIATITGDNNKLNVDACLGPLRNNGGPTQTHAPRAGSPVINAGSNNQIPAGVITDQRGTGFDRVIGGKVDIGAVEFNPASKRQIIRHIALFHHS